MDRERQAGNMLPCLQEARSRRPNTSGGRETLTLLDCLYRNRIRTIFLDVHRPRFALDTITVGPSLKRSVALKDGDVSASVQRLADDMNAPARIMPKVNELPTQRRDWPLGGSAISAGGEIDCKAAFDMMGDVGPDQFDGVHGGEDRWDQCRIPFLLVVMLKVKAATPRPNRHSLRCGGGDLRAPRTWLGRWRRCKQKRVCGRYRSVDRATSQIALGKR